MSAAALEGRLDPSCMPGSPLYGEIVYFLYREAELLDSGRFGEWVASFADDIRYTMPVRTRVTTVARSATMTMFFMAASGPARRPRAGDRSP